MQLLAEWERWAAELLESHVSYPILCYYRSQHDNQSWLSALVAVLENFQNEDGSVSVPPVLAPWMGGLTQLVP